MDFYKFRKFFLIAASIFALSLPSASNCEDALNGEAVVELEKEAPRKPKKGGAKKEDNAEADIMRSVITVKIGSNSGATAFFAEIKGKYFVVTNFHVVSGKQEPLFTTIDGVIVDLPDAGYIGDSRDVYIIPLASLPRGAAALPISENVIAEAGASDDIMICGNPLDGRVLLNAHGKLKAFGPETLELECPLFPGNSGSPIYHKKSGKVVGVVSHASVLRGDSIISGARKMGASPIKNSMRYFGVRIDSVRNWVFFPRTEVRAQLEDIASFENKINVIKNFQKDSYRKIVVDNNYPEFEKIAYKYGKMMGRISNGKQGRSRGDALGRVAEREMCEELERLLGHEVAKIKGRKFNDKLKDDASSALESLERFRDIFAARAKAEILN